MATHFSILAWRISQTEEPDGLQSMGSQESDMTKQLNSNNSSLSPQKAVWAQIPGIRTDISGGPTFHPSQRFLDPSMSSESHLLTANPHNNLLSIYTILINPNFTSVQRGHERESETVKIVITITVIY